MKMRRGVVSWLFSVVVLVAYSTSIDAAIAESKTIDPLPRPEIGENMQQIVTGRATDSAGVLLVGVSVTLKHRPSYGTSTDLNGRYSIDLPPQSTLVFSMVGYESQEILVGNQPTIDVILLPSSSMLDDVVVVGFGQQKKT